MIVDRERVLSSLREQREHIEQRYGMRMIGIVGSVARGEATEAERYRCYRRYHRRTVAVRSFRRRTGTEEAVGVGLAG